MYSKVSRYSLYGVLVLSFLIQLLFLDNMKVAGVKPDILAITVVFFAIFFGPGIGAEAGLVSGLLKDVYSLDIFGANSVLMLLMGFVVGVLSPKIFKESKLTQLSIVFLSSVLYMTAHYLLSSFILSSAYASLYEYMYNLILPSSLYTALLSAVIFPFLVNRYHLKEQAEYL